MVALARAFEAETWPIHLVKPYDRNARRIPAAAVLKVARSITEFGWRQPIVVDEDGVILAGHTRLQAATQLGLTEVPVHVARGLTPEQARAFRLMDNRSHDETAWDPDLLGVEIGELKGLGVDLAMTGFDPAEIDRALGLNPGLTDEDAAPDVPAVPVTVRGDLWRLGPHRLKCGNSCQAADVEHLVGAARPNLMVTDPPYGVSYDPLWRERVTGQKVRARGAVPNDDRADWHEAWALFPGNVAYVWHGALHAGTVQNSLARAGLEVRSQIIWEKDRFVLSRGHYHWRHEPCWYAVRRGKAADWRGGRKKDTLWHVDAVGPVDAFAIAEHLRDQGVEETLWRIPLTVDDGSTGHGTQKPVECMRRPILNNSDAGHAVYDPFVGSGTTVIAAETTSRVCLAMDVDPGYCDVVVARWQAFTGQVAYRESDGKAFDAAREQTQADPPQADHG